jgi:hypothetical protein
MIFKTDIVIYSVSYMNDNGIMITDKHTSFASAAGQASALTDRTRLLNVSASDVEGMSSISGTLYVYSKGQSERRAANKHLINQVTQYESFRTK